MTAGKSKRGRILRINPCSVHDGDGEMDVFEGQRECHKVEFWQGLAEISVCCVHRSHNLAPASGRAGGDREPKGGLDEVVIINLTIPSYVFEPSNPPRFWRSCSFPPVLFGL